VLEYIDSWAELCTQLRSTPHSVARRRIMKSISIIGLSRRPAWGGAAIMAAEDRTTTEDTATWRDRGHNRPPPRRT